MSQGFKDIEHLLRLAGLFTAGLLVFLVVRATMVPKDFGELGHYRSGSLKDNREEAIVLAGREACNECHPDVAEISLQGGHGKVGCEACHGALADHAGEPTEFAPKRLEPARLCPVCHQRNVAISNAFPQVDAAEHSGGLDCSDCHEPHSPAMGF